MLYIIQAGEYYKIGISKHPEKRLKSISTGCPMPPRLIHQFNVGENDKDHESRIHSLLIGKRTNGEWFKLSNIELDLLVEIFKSNSIPVIFPDGSSQITTRGVINPMLFSRNEAISFCSSSDKGFTKAWAKSKGMSYPLKKGWKKRSISALKKYFSISNNEILTHYNG